MNWGLVVLLVAVCLPGILWTVPRSLERMLASIDPDRELPPFRVLAAAGVGQTILFVAIAAAVGAATAPAVGFGAPVFEAMLAGRDLWAALEPQLVPTLVASVVGSAGFLLAYYGLVRPRLGTPSVRALESLRADLGIPGRVLYGGVVEEVLARWGLMSLFAWASQAVLGPVTPAMVWVAILGSGILFGLGHLPSYLGAGGRRTPVAVVSMIGLNLWASVIFGWLFWQYGLTAAMLSHSLFHLFWVPLDRRFIGTAADPAPSSSSETVRL